MMTKENNFPGHYSPLVYALIHYVKVDVRRTFGKWIEINM